jgi:hypothetical protein
MKTRLYASHSTNMEGGNSKYNAQERKKKQSNHATNIGFTKNESTAAYLWQHSMA